MPCARDDPIEVVGAGRHRRGPEAHIAEELTPIGGNEQLIVGGARGERVVDQLERDRTLNGVEERVLTDERGECLTVGGVGRAYRRRGRRCGARLRLRCEVHEVLLSGCLSSHRRLADFVDELRVRPAREPRRARHACACRQIAVRVHVDDMRHAMVVDA